MTAPLTSSLAPDGVNASRSAYLIVGTLLTVFSFGLALLPRTGQLPPPAEALLAPIVALVGLTALVWLSMVLVRNATILRGITRADYYRDYQSFAPPEWVERPARTFNNLLQVPVLFYLVCVLMLITRNLDQAQLDIAWTYVVMRVIHATIYIGWNNVTYRFASWVASCITLGVLWVRFVMQSWPA